MSGRHSDQRKKNSRRKAPTAPTIVNEVPSQEGLDVKEEDDMDDRKPDSKPKRKWATALGIFISAVALVAYFTQAYYMRQAMRVDQRAWISHSRT